MSTTTSLPPTNNSKYYLNPLGGPSPPEAYFYSKSASTSPSSMAQQPPPWNAHLKEPGVRGRVVPEDYSPGVTQLRPRRQPLYLPAALRPTEPAPLRGIPYYPRPPDTPPQSHGNSFDGHNPHMSSSYDDGALVFDNGEEARTQLDRELSSLALGEGLEDHPEPVTGPPTTAHWKPDAISKSCAICHIPFTWYFRRHHCRHCGEVVCDNHIKHKVPLDQNARFHVNGEQSKACPRCHERWTSIKKQRDSRANSIAEFQLNSSDPAAEGEVIVDQQPNREEERETYHASDYWSTF